MNNWKLTIRLGALVLGYGLAATAAFAQVTDYLGLPGPIELGGQSYVLAWSSSPQDNYIKHEYVPEGQVLEQFEDMVIVEILIAPFRPIDTMAMQVEHLNQTRGEDPVFNFDMLHNETNGEAVLDFLLSEQDAEGEYMIEWNAYRYAPYENAEGETGVLLFAISHRAYGNDASQAFLENLGALRSSEIDALVSAPLPEPAN